MHSVKIAVIGAGLTGLSFAFHYGSDTPIFEKDTEVGGLVRTKEVRGCRFDLAPHLLHLRSEYVRELVFNTLGLKLKAHRRRARIYCGGNVIPYPFELNLYGVSETIRQECLSGLERIDAASRDNLEELKAGSYKEYVLRAFGPGIGRHYLLPYNQKIWATDPAAMTCEWMKWLPTADIAKIRRNAREPDNEEFGYNAHFYYPEQRGIQELPETFAAQLTNIQTGREVVNIDTRKGALLFADGEKLKYERLVSTMPLITLARCSDRPELKMLAEGLRHTTVCVINMVIRGRLPDQAHWMYFPDPALDFYRISFPKNFFEKATPVDEQILSVEVGGRDNRPDIDRIRARVEEQVGNLDIFEIEEHLFTHCDVIPVAYSIFDSRRTARVKQLTDAFREVGIYSIGRYGQWDYSAMEDAILYGKKLAEEFRNT